MYFDQAREAKPELLDDWDQRLVVTTLQVDAEGERIELNQVAEKDQVPGAKVEYLLRQSLIQWMCKDTTLVLDVDPLEKDTMIMTCMVDDIIALRKFQRQNNTRMNRKISAPF